MLTTGAVPTRPRPRTFGPVPRVVDTCLVGSDPALMLTGPIPATQRLLERNSMTIDDFDVIEINEAFASVVLAWEREFEPAPATASIRTEPRSPSAIPLGATGSIPRHEGAPRARTCRSGELHADHDVLRRGPRHRHDHRAAVTELLWTASALGGHLLSTVLMLLETTSRRLRSLPVGRRGRSSTKRTDRGHLKWERRCAAVGDQLCRPARRRLAARPEPAARRR